MGAGRRVEIGLNLTGNIQPGADSTTLVPAIKYKAYDGRDNGWAFVVGDHVFIPVRNKSYAIGKYVYARSARPSRARPGLLLGGYHFSYNIVAASAQRAGGQFGFEQPITSNLALPPTGSRGSTPPVTTRLE